MHSIITAVTEWIKNGIGSLGYWGVFIMMGIESACIPLPSEIIMPFGGYLVYMNAVNHTDYSIWWMGVAGAAGCVWGSVLAYWVGKLGGRPFVAKYGKYILIRQKDMDKADEWFTKHGDAAIFFSRLMPVVRTFISFPAGVSGMPFWRFCIYTFIGSLPWCIGLAWVGCALGREWDTRLKTYFHGADVIIVCVFLILAALYIYHHIKSDKEYIAEKKKQAE